MSSNEVIADKERPDTHLVYLVRLHENRRSITLTPAYALNTLTDVKCLSAGINVDNFCGQIRVGCVRGQKHVHFRPADNSERSLERLRCVHQNIVAARGIADRKSTRLNSSHTVISYAVF